MPSHELHKSVLIAFLSLIIIPILGAVNKWPTWSDYRQLKCSVKWEAGQMVRQNLAQSCMRHKWKTRVPLLRSEAQCAFHHHTKISVPTVINRRHLSCRCHCALSHYSEPVSDWELTANKWLTWAVMSTYNKERHTCLKIQVQITFFHKLRACNTHWLIWTHQIWIIVVNVITQSATVLVDTA